MRILFLSPRQCWPATSGAKLREYFLARALGGAFELTHVSFTPPGERPLAAADLPFCRRVATIPVERPYTPGRIARGLFGRYPLPVLNYTSRAMFALLERVLAEDRFDLVHLESLHMFAYSGFLRNATGAPVIYDWHNIESEAMARYAARVKPPRAWYAALTARRLAALETRILEEASGHLVCSGRERDQISRCAPRARVAVIENGVDTSYFADAADVPRRRIVFVGQMSYHANIDAVTFFARRLWPRIAERHPQWIFSVVGSNPAPPVLALRDLPRVEVTGAVPDVRPYYHDAVAAVVPLRVGGGTRLKILEAMAAGIPVVSTAVGAEGLAVSSGENILMAETPDQWIAALDSLSADATLHARLAAAGRALARGRYDWSRIGESLVAAYRGWLDRP